MRRNLTIILALASCMLLTLPFQAQAKTSIMNDWLAYYSACQSLVDLSCGACHQNGFDYNPYGETLRFRTEDLNMTNTDAFIDAEDVDSDGDGYTNGQEIVIDCTLPGAAGSHGTVADDTQTWGQIKALFR